MNENDRLCGNCYFGVKDPRTKETMRFCAMSKNHEMHLATTTAAELKCRAHLFNAKKENEK